MKKIIVSALLCICTVGLKAQTCSPAGNSQFDFVRSALRTGLFTAPNDSPDSIGCYAAAFGMQTKPKGYASFTIGNFSSTTGDYSFAGGSYSIASGQNSASLGLQTSATSNEAFALGAYSRASGSASLATGRSTTASNFASTAMGYYTIASGHSSTSIGISTQATTEAAFAGGTNSIASGSRSFAFGVNALAPGYESTSMGTNTNSSGIGSHTLGYYSQSSGNYSFAIGSYADSRAPNSFSIGNGTITKAIDATVLGSYNDSTDNPNPLAYASTDRVFQVGNGNYSARNNALTVLRNGNVGVGVLNPTTKLHVKGEVGFWSSNKTWTVGYDSINHYFFIDEYGFGKKLFIKDGGNVGIGVPAPAHKLEVGGNIKSSDIYANNNIQVDMGNINVGSLTNALRFGPLSSGEGIGSRRSGNGNALGIDFYTNNQNRMTITNSGNVGINLPDQFITEKLQVSGNAKVSGNVIVQSNKGIIRSNDATQQKKVTTPVNVNITLSPGQTKIVSLSWAETFSATPDAFVGNITSGPGGWAEVVLSLADVTSTGATLFVFNPRSVAVTPGFTVKIIAIGAQ